MPVEREPTAKPCARERTDRPARENRDLQLCPVRDCAATQLTFGPERYDDLSRTTTGISRSVFCWYVS